MSMLLVLAATGCRSASPIPTEGTTASASSVTSSAQVAPLVGRWEQAHDCTSLVDAMKAAGLGPIAVYEVAGEFFPEVSIRDLTQKSDLCAGAEPFRHAHFFDASGNFGSLDQHGNQVDDGIFTIVDDSRVRIGDSMFRYRVTNGDTLALRPVISNAARAEALDHPGKFTQAVWMVSVAYTGTTWQRVACGGWC